MRAFPIAGALALAAVAGSAAAWSQSGGPTPAAPSSAGPSPASAPCPAGSGPPAFPRRAGGPPPGYADPYAGRKRVLFVADTHTGNQNAHDALSHAMGVLEETARRAGIVLYLRTDTQWVTLADTYGTGDYARCGKKQARGRSLKDFDAVVFYTNGETDMTAQQKADLLTWLREGGHGFVGIHTATATGTTWPEYGRMIGGYFDNHPWGIAKARIRVERPDFPGMAGYVADPYVTDEHYEFLPPYSRETDDVLASIDTRSVPMDGPEVHRRDGDFPVAWIKTYGKGRVFYSDLGHSDASWDDPRQQALYLEAIRWAARITSYPVRPHAMPKQ